MIQTLNDWPEIRAVEQPSCKEKLGYPSWVRHKELALDWSKEGQWLVVMDPQVEIWSTPDESSIVHLRAPFDSRQAFLAQRPEWNAVRLPDGRKGWVRSDGTRLTADLKDPYRLEKLMVTAHALPGGPYLWGGITPSAFDCSGFVFRLYHAHDITLARDTQDQAILGHRVDKSELKPGDLLFYSSRPDRQVTHVALYTGEERVVIAALNLGLTERPMVSLHDTRVQIRMVRLGED